MVIAFDRVEPNKYVDLKYESIRVRRIIIANEQMVDWLGHCYVPLVHHDKFDKVCKHI